MFAVLLASVTYRRGRLKGGGFLYWILVATDTSALAREFAPDIGRFRYPCSRGICASCTSSTTYVPVGVLLRYLLHPCSRVLTRHFPHPVDRVRQNDDSKDYWDLIRVFLAYNVENNTLQILRVIHSKQDWPQAFY